MAGACCLSITLSDLDAFYPMIGMISGFSVGITLSLLAGFHIWLLATNRTTLEMHGFSDNFNAFGGDNIKENF